MSEPLKKFQPSPRHYIERRSVWNDIKGRTLVCMDIWENGEGYSIDFLLVGGPKVLEFISVPWMNVYRSIEQKQMQLADIRNLKAPVAKAPEKVG